MTQGERVGMRWREQAGINLEGARETAVAEAYKDGTEEKMRGINGRLLVWGNVRGYSIA